ncbi:serine protease snake-like [Ostrinia furnacalis]|uniref:serine protease snake-like n=1 Tax=Ostrinia furnacalis TaxID=93504 RepID=UPI001040AE98|nr:serine protease snake-like [Ostrinia furnacalis]
MMILKLLLQVALFLVIKDSKAQRNDGDSCVDTYTGTLGVCRPAEACKQAKNDYEFSGIRPTFCEYNAFGQNLVCCRDGKTILQTAKPRTVDPPPVWTEANDNRRVSEKKCDAYSRSVLSRVDASPLSVDNDGLTFVASKCHYTSVELIIGGEDATRGEFPHMAAIGWANFDGGYDFNCGGSLLSRRFVLTAGHCSKDPRARDPAPAVVRLGDQNIDSRVNDGADPIDVPIRHIHTHPDYKSPVKYNDIALIELATDVVFEDAIRPACLWTKDGFRDYEKAIATGWGVKDVVTKETSKELQKVSLSLLQNEQCDPLLNHNRNWKGFVPQQMCAGELRGGKDTCQGDSGSPIQAASKQNPCIFYILGVTSFGKQCGKTGQPAIYTRVSSYVDWIESIVWPGE